MISDAAIRKATKQNLHDCARLMAETDPWLRFGYKFDDCLKKIADPRMDVYVAIYRKQIAGFIAMRAQGMGSSTVLPLCCVAAELRNQGLGTNLIRFAENIVFKHDKNLFAFVSAFNKGSLRLCQRLGYNIIGEIENYNLEGISELILRKTIGPRLQTNSRD